MTYGSSECRTVRRDLLRRSDLCATDRSRLDLHLNRCEHCSAIYEEFKAIEDLTMDAIALDETRQQAIYNGLIPVVNEITSEIRDRAGRVRPLWRSPRRNWVVGFSGAVAACLLVAFVARMIGWNGTDGVDGSEGEAGETWLHEAPIVLSSVVDRHEGRVVIDGKPAVRPERFSLQRGSFIKVEEDARFSFHIGELARVAMFGDTQWELTSITDGFIGMNLDQGRIAVNFDGTMHRTMEVSTPDAIVRVKGTVFTVEIRDDGKTEVGVVEGLVEVVSKRGKRGTMQVAKGEMGVIPGDGNRMALSDRHRSIAAELTLEPYPEEVTRLVRFFGSPERVKVEVDGRLLGAAPLAIRLPDAPFSYRLTYPGMEPVVGSVINHGGNEGVAYAMVPTERFDPMPGEATEPQVLPPRVHRTGNRKPPPPKREWNIFNRARSAMRAGDLPFAIDLLEKAMEKGETDRQARTLQLLAESYGAAGMYGKAADAYDRLSLVSTDKGMSQNARYEVGRLSMDQLGDIPRARAAFTAYVAAPEGGGLKEEAYYSLCELNSREGSYRDSLHCFDQFLRSFPGGSHESDAHLWRGALYQDVRKEWRRAETDLIYFIRRKPHHPRADEARYRVVIGRYQQGDREGVLQMISEYLTQHPRGQYRVRVERMQSAVMEANFSLKPTSN